MDEERFNATSLPVAITGLFKLNGYHVTGPVIKNGGEVDLVATKPSDLFADPIYIEATIEHVGNEKFAKDLTKLWPIQRSEPNAKVVIVSARGFTAAVRTKAQESGITTWTFDELEQRFQRFEPLLEECLGDTATGRELTALDAIYEEPNFNDAMGTQAATGWLSDWLLRSDGNPWLIVTGEYGTGKTALTKVLLRSWLSAYRTNASLPIPFRLELRNFTRQFDARGLLHNFLDSSGLGGLSIDFVLAMIRSGRVVLLLDGYDEMAQYMNARERRACLEALAQLSADGARGILTSRPNYFSEAEELQVLEALYRELERRDHLLPEETEILAEEAEVDALFEAQIINRVERHLEDLSPEQTEELIRRKFVNDQDAQDVVIRLLRRIFRSTAEGAAVALSGKPVIITYLLEIAEDLKSDAVGDDDITEWQVYDLIVRHLMARDFRASSEILPDRRRQFLRRLAVRLSKRDTSSLEDEDFREFVRSEFEADLRRFPPESRDERLQQLSTDLRRSATLTRAIGRTGGGYLFSHNSLREYLACEAILEQLNGDSARRFDMPVTDAMRTFVASQGDASVMRHRERMAVLWPARTQDDGAGQLLSLLWTGLLACTSNAQDPVRTSVAAITGDGLDLSRAAIDGLDLTTLGNASLPKASFASCNLTRVSFRGLGLRGASFESAVLDEVDFAAADLTDTTFRLAALADVDITGAVLKGADFREVDDTVLELRDGAARYAGPAALGLLRATGALTVDIDPIHVLRHHPKFDVASKVSAVFLDGAKHQVRGLTQRGSAQSDPRFAGRFLALLIKDEFVSLDKNRQLVRINDSGRRLLGPFVSLEHAPQEVEAIFRTAVR